MHQHLNRTGVSSVFLIGSEKEMVTSELTATPVDELVERIPHQEDLNQLP